MICALPVRHVVEILRPLPVEAVRGAPDFVRGMALVRGAPAPVVDAARLLTGNAGGTIQRYVSLRADGSRVMLAVEAVLGVHTLDAATLEELPTLLSSLNASSVQRIGAYGQQLIFLLDAARLVGPDLARQLPLQESRA